MPGFREAFEQGRNQARASRGAPPLSGLKRDAFAEEAMTERGQDQQEPPSWGDAPEAGSPAAVAELQAALLERDGELTENRRLLAEVKDYAEQLQSRVVELIAGAEPMAKALRLPGVKTFLLQRFHPDKYPAADDRQRELLTEAMKTITAAYALAGEIQTSE
jgi:hypothetical protein